jgi:hypothetical protein
LYGGFRQSHELFEKRVYSRQQFAFHPAKAGKPTWLGEMQTPSAIFVLLPQTAAANKATVCVGGEP